MRILRIAQKLYPEHKGGGPYHVHAMSRDQAELGHDVTILTVSDDPSLPLREERDGYTIIRRRPTVNALGNDISIGLARLLKDARAYDVIHAHSHLYFSTNLAALKQQFSDIPLAITNHGLYSQNAPKWIFDGYLRTVGRWTFNSADLIFCYTAEDRSRVENLGVDTDIAVVPNGVDTDRFRPDGPQSELIDHDGPVILFVGRLVVGKRPQDAIKAVAELPDALNAKCYIVGEGPLREDLIGQWGETVGFLGHVSYDEMPAIYRAADSLLLTSRAEGLPRTVLESFASGVPVVTSHLEHTTSVVNRGGETVPIGDIEGYSKALSQVLDEQEVLRVQGRKAAVEEFQWGQTVAATTVKLEELF